MAIPPPPHPGRESKHAANDAMYLFELFRESPIPIVINVASYAAKTGTKVNTIQKRLGEIKKRNGLNIITTAAASGGCETPLSTSGARGSSSQGNNAKAQRRPGTKQKVKKEEIQVEAGAIGEAQGREKPEYDCSGHGLPSPAASTDCGLRNEFTATNPTFMPQKRRISNSDEAEFSEADVASKKIKVDPEA